MTQPTQIQVLGAHRGGGAYSENFIHERPHAPIRVQVVDPQPERAAALAALWQQHGVPAAAQQRRAEEACSEPSDIRVLAVDNANALLRVFEQGSQRLLQFGLLVASPDTPHGGLVLGFGGSLPADQVAMHRQAYALMERVAVLTGGESVTSRAMSAQPINSFQMDTTRSLVHQKLVEDAQGFLEGRPGGNLFVAETMSLSPPYIYPLAALVQVESPHLTRQEMREQARNIAASRMANGPGAVVVFCRPDAAWLYVVFLRVSPHDNKGKVQRTVEIPPSALPMPAAPTTILATD